jgi:hypothetical protein
MRAQQDRIHDRISKFTGFPDETDYESSAETSVPLLFLSFFFKRGSVPPRCTLGSAILHEFFLRNGSN